jgi:hypothetical protein
MGQDEVGNCVQGCPSSSPKQETEPEPPSNDLSHFIEFNFALESGQPIADDSGFILTGPDGSKQEGVLSGGGFKRQGVQEGAYHLKFRYIVTCGWQRSVAIGEPTVAMWVKTVEIPDGTNVLFKVSRRFQTALQPLQSINAALHGNSARVAFKYKQKLGESPGGEFVFEVEIGQKRSLSDVLSIGRYSISTIKGVQQRLKELGFDPGPIDGLAGPNTKKAVRAFQKTVPELKEDGIPGPETRSELDNVW